MPHHAPPSLRAVLPAFAVLAGSGATAAPAAAQACASDASVETAGLATLGASGLPAIALEGAPLVGHPFALRVTGGPALGHGVLILGLGAAPVDLPRYGATLYPGPGARALPFALDAGGASRALLADAALEPSLCGAARVVQAALVDPAATGGVAFTQAARIAVGGAKGGPVFPGRRFPAEDPRRVVTADLDGDGALDLLTVNGFGPLHAVLRGVGDGTFLPAQPFGNPDSLADALTTGDWNGDGVLDVAAVVPALDRIGVHLGQGDGSFGPGDLSLVMPYPEAIASGVLASGAGPSLAVTNHHQDEVRLFHARPDGGFVPAPLPGGLVAVGAEPVAVALADLDGDAVLDLATANRESDDLSLARGLGDGTFAPATSLACGAAPTGLEVADLDADGALDLVVIESGPRQATVFLGAGGGAFAALAPLPLANLGVPALGDLDGDGALDLVVSGEGLVSTYRGAGDGTFAPLQAFASGTSPAGPAVGDLDGDGRADLAIADAQGGGVSVVLGTGGGLLATELVAPVGGPDGGTYGLDGGDFDGDQVPDLAVTSLHTDEVVLLLGAGDGTFPTAASFPAGAPPDALEAGDLDGDGDLDVAAVSRSDPGLFVLPGAGDGTLGPPQPNPLGSGGDEVELADLDADGTLDVVAPLVASPAIAVALGAGDGTFPAPTSYAAGPGTQRAVPCDANRDGFLDVVAGDVAGSGTSLPTAGYTVFLGNGDGSLAAGVQTALSLGATVPTSTSSIAAGDLDRDGVVDLALTMGSFASAVVPLRGVGDGTFVQGPSRRLGAGAGWVEIADVDADLRSDVVVAHGFAGEVWVLPGLGGGELGTARVFPVRDTARELALGDWNGDLLPDAAVACTSQGEVSVLLNQVLR